MSALELYNPLTFFEIEKTNVTRQLSVRFLVLLLIVLSE
jgi:hypothetical protein